MRSECVSKWLINHIQLKDMLNLAAISKKSSFSIWICKEPVHFSKWQHLEKLPL